MNRLYLAVLTAAILAYITGCSSDPVNPGIEPDANPASRLIASDNSHHLLGYSLIQIDTESGQPEVIPLRNANLHLNVVGIMNQTMGVSAAGVPSESDPANGYFVLDITLTHPFETKPQFSGFDVRGILITKGTLNLGGFYIADVDEPQLVNRDGYTRWWNAYEFNTPGAFGYIQGILSNTSELLINSNVNPYKYFADALDAEGSLHTIISTPMDDDVGRGVFTAGSSNTRRYEIQFEMNPGPVVQYGYAIDASWAMPDPNPPSEIPDNFPIEANSPEAYYVQLNDVINTLFVTPGGDSGGAMTLVATIADWQGQQTGDFQSEIQDVTIYAPDLFDGGFAASYYTENPYGIFYYADFLGNAAPAHSGDVRVICEVTSSNGNYDQGLGDAPDGSVAAYQAINVGVEEITCAFDNNLEPFELNFDETIRETVCFSDDPSDLYVITVDPGFEPSGSIMMFCDVQDMHLNLYNDRLELLDQVIPVDGYATINLDDFDYDSGQIFIEVETFDPDSISYYILGLSGEPVDVTPTDPAELTPDEWFMFAEYTWIHESISYSMGSRGAWVYDIGDLQNPIYMGQAVERIGGITDAVFKYPYAYYIGHNIESTEEILGMVDFSNPADPIFYDSISTGSDILDSICMDSTYIYLGYHTGGGSHLVVAFDYLSSPTDPSSVGFVSVEDIPEDIAIMNPDTPNPILIVSTANDELNAYDISDLSSITKIGTGYPHTFQYVNDMDVYGNHVLLAGKLDAPTDPGLLIVDLNGEFFIGKGVAPVGPYLKRLVYEWPYIFMTSDFNQFAVVNADNVQDPVVVDTITSPVDLGSIAVEDEKLAVVKAADGLVFYDATDPSNVGQPKELEPVNTPVTGVFDISSSQTMIAGNILTLELIVYDVDAMPLILDRYKTGIGPYNLTSFEDLLVVSQQSGGSWEPYDITDAHAPSWFGNTEYPTDWLGAIQLYENALYAADLSGTDIYVYDVTDPSNPTLTNTLSTVDHIIDFEIFPGYLYAMSANGLLQYDTTDPLNPLYEGTVNPAISAYLDITAEGNYMYVSSQGYLIILDVSTPDSPSTVSSLDHGILNLTTITVNKQFAFLQGPEMEIHVFRIWPRDDPAYVGTFNGYGGCYDLKTLDDLLYVFSSYAGLRIFELP